MKLKPLYNDDEPNNYLKNHPRAYDSLVIRPKPLKTIHHTTNKRTRPKINPTVSPANIEKQYQEAMRVMREYDKWHEENVRINRELNSLI